jgi:hypothetical protein
LIRGILKQSIGGASVVKNSWNDILYIPDFPVTSTLQGLI